MRFGAQKNGVRRTPRFLHGWRLCAQTLQENAGRLLAASHGVWTRRRVLLLSSFSTFLMQHAAAVKSLFLTLLLLCCCPIL